MRAVALIGFMGAGKTVVGQKLAKRLKLPFVDLDNQIEAKTGKSINQIFAEQGEEYFRLLEREALLHVDKPWPHILATGGGVILKPENRDWLKQNYSVVYLKADKERLIDRLRKEYSQRPLLKDNFATNFMQIYETRQNIYPKVADFEIDSSHLSVEQVVKRLGKLIETKTVHKVTVDLKKSAYPIFIGEGLLARLGELLSKVTLPKGQHKAVGGKAVIFTNPAIGRHWGAKVKEQLSKVFAHVEYKEIPAGERAKGWRTALKLYDYLLSIGVDRQTVLVALGGGVIGDLVGFVAATFMRGLAYMQIPTTLMAQIDSSIGGKTAINHPLAKNIIGAFYQPKAVFIDPLVLQTLPAKEFKNGLSELIKYAFIAGKPAPPVLAATLGTPYLKKCLDWLIEQAVEVKASIVAQDEKEQGLRAILNYGHTVGHALEAATGYRRLRHGEAVALGMLAAAELAFKLGFIGRELVEQHYELVQKAGLPTKWPQDISLDIVSKSLFYDKKRLDENVRFVLLKEIGQPELFSVSADKLTKVLLS